MASLISSYFRLDIQILNKICEDQPSILGILILCIIGNIHRVSNFFRAVTDKVKAVSINLVQYFKHSLLVIFHV